jgi:hypothetical protein
MWETRRIYFEKKHPMNTTWHKENRGKSSRNAWPTLQKQPVKKGALADQVAVLIIRRDRRKNPVDPYMKRDGTSRRTDWTNAEPVSGTYPSYTFDLRPPSSHVERCVGVELPHAKNADSGTRRFRSSNLSHGI